MADFDRMKRKMSEAQRKRELASDLGMHKETVFLTERSLSSVKLLLTLSLTLENLTGLSSIQRLSVSILAAFE